MGLHLLNAYQDAEVIESDPDRSPKVCTVSLWMAAPSFSVSYPLDHLEVVHVDYDRANGDAQDLQEGVELSADDRGVGFLAHADLSP